MNPRLLAAALVLCPLLALATEEDAPLPEAPGSDAPVPAAPGPDAPRSPVPAPPAPRETRRGYYVSAGAGSGGGRLGVGSADGSRSLERYMGAAPTRVALSLEGGATVGERLLLGAELTWFRASARAQEQSAAIQLVQVDLVATFYPLGSGPFLRAGGGLANLGLSSRAPGASYSRSPSGFGLVAGAGYGYRVWRAVHLTLRLDVTRQWLDAPEIGAGGSYFWVGYAGVSWL